MVSSSADLTGDAVEPGPWTGFRSAAFTSLRTTLLGAAAGAWAGLLIGGVGGRIAMFVLRLTSTDAVRGVESDDGFEIGRISGATVLLLGITTIFGAIIGVVYIAVRSGLPPRVRRLVWTITGAALGGSALIEPDGVDFTLVEPHWLAVAFFIVIPGAAAALMSTLAERWTNWWWVDTRRTVAAAVPVTVTILLVLPFVAAILAALLVAIAAQNRPITTAARTLGPWLVRVGLAAVATLAAWGLAHDVGTIL